ncbi:hypothetical protein MSAN_00892400 [Mycena sanguinolenta]|uniref:DUF6534 domain-containing protein n=1 Tax=Mycena sanguinolenta TaxID=230812 RepID=A0A8H6YW98_9AGAR|nr:hypothetical protein MSAN_00892400 [Mycena sanguinolenta]
MLAYNFLAFGHSTVSAGKQSQQLTAVAISLRASGAATDIIIAGAMIYLLNQTRSQFTSTQRLISALLVLSVNSGAWTAILAVLDFISILAFPVDFTFCVFELPLCSLYLSTLLLNLNARKFINRVDGSIDLADMTRSGNRAHGESGTTIHFVSPRQTHRHSTGTAVLSQAESGSTTLQKFTSTSREDVARDKPEEVIV